MKLKFINPNDLEKNLKATIHKTGKMGFTTDAATKLGLSVDRSASIAIDEEDFSNNTLYILMHNSKKANTFNISKAGDYYYINTKILFDNLKIDYKNQSVVYDITEEQGQNGEKGLYKLQRRGKNLREEDISVEDLM